jgi:hypothetical protein
MLLQSTRDLCSVFLADDIGVSKTMIVIAFWVAKVANYLDWREV